MLQTEARDLVRAPRRKHDRGRPMINYSIRTVILASMCVALNLVAAPTVKAASEFDGEWKGVAITKSGPCDESYRFSGQIIDGAVRSPVAPNNVSGHVAPSGAVSVSAAMGNNHGVAWGRLSSKSGRGTWKGRLGDADCSGVWSVERQ
jgi:hypothetical protein